VEVTTSDLVLYDVSEGVARLTLNRPDRMNAWTISMEQRYFDRLQQATDSPDVVAIVVTGAGRAFCPGGDMEVLNQIGDGDGGAGVSVSTDPRPATFPMTVPKPVIGAINGACAGIGLVQALMFDVRFAAAGAKFTTAFTRIGLVAELASSWLLPRVVGTSRALDLLISARTFTAEEALELGVVNRVVASEDVVDAATAYARDLAQTCSPAAMATVKRQVHAHADATLEVAVEESSRLNERALAGADFKEGVTSFLEKRRPAFSRLGAC
jgi:enoyl-CoA hydratase/carnithine racemase